VSLATAAE